MEILLADRLDHETNDPNGKLSFTVIAIPLWIALIAWLTFSFGATDANPCRDSLLFFLSIHR